MYRQASSFNIPNHLVKDYSIENQQDVKGNKPKIVKRNIKKKL